MTQSIVIFILIAVFQAVAGYYAKKAKEKQAAAEAAGRGEGSGVGASPSLDGTRPVQVSSVRPMSAEQAIAVARLIEQRKVVEAVMALRAICNLGLAEARDVIQQFPARGFPAELLVPGAMDVRGASASAPAASLNPLASDEDREALSQDGDEDESNDARNSLEHVRAAVEGVRAEVRTVLDQALRSAGAQPSTPVPAPVVAPAQAPPPPAIRAVRVGSSSEAAAPAARPRTDRSVVADSVTGLLRSRQGARQAILMSEILGAPRAFRPLR